MGSANADAIRTPGDANSLLVPTDSDDMRATADVDGMRALIADNGIDLVSFTSSSTVANFAAMVGVPVAGLKAAAIGPITAETARAHGFDVVVAPTEYTVAALIAAIVQYYAREALT